MGEIDKMDNEDIKKEAQNGIRVIAYTLYFGTIFGASLRYDNEHIFAIGLLVLMLYAMCEKPAKNDVA